ncbi:UbiA prenyltransferase family-domain-containing protein [Mycena vulgaris]|nr:UbiA prenyltransferase family-domain-containing protein [Mycena vulgaris]
MPRSTVSQPRLLTSAIIFHGVNIYLFCKSDITTTLVPVSLLAFAATPICRENIAFRGLQAIFWLFLHLLQFNLSNQLYSVEEDRKNHAYRPLAAGRLSTSSAFILRWLSTVVCLVVSTLYSPLMLLTSVMSALFAFFYNETPLHKHWIFRATFNSLGYGAFKLGTMLVSNCDRSSLDTIAFNALLISMGIIWTTVYVQDFQDVEGDYLMSRGTLPLLYPRLSRLALLPNLLGWSIFLCYFWSLPPLSSVTLILFTMWIARRFITSSGISVDKVSYAWYGLAYASSSPDIIGFVLSTGLVGDSKALTFSS